MSPSDLSARHAAYAGLALVLFLAPPDLTRGIPYPSEPPRISQCPDQLLGPWRSSLDVEKLFTVGITIAQRPPGNFVAKIRSAWEEEESPVWRDGERLRFQSLTLPIALDGTLAPDSGTIGGFVQYASTIARTVLRRADLSGENAWDADFTPLGVTVQAVPFDLYVERDDDGIMAGYFFFRDQRLPGLWGYGLECQEGIVRLGEKNLGLTFEGVSATGFR
jgi:hypothetical protein